MNKIILLLISLIGVSCIQFIDIKKVEFLSNKPIDIHTIYKFNAFDKEERLTGLCNKYLKQEITKISISDIEYEPIYPYDPIIIMNYDILYNAYKINNYKYMNKIELFYETDIEYGDEGIIQYHDIFIDNIFYTMSFDEELFVSDFYVNDDKIF